jgi:hypothetical protein
MTTFTTEDRLEVQKVKEKDPSYYYSPEEWSRSVGYGVVPDERNSELKDNNVPTTN